MTGLLSAAVTNAVCVTLLTALIAVAVYRLRRAPAVLHLLCVLALAKLLMPPLIGVPLALPKGMTAASPPTVVQAGPTADVAAAASATELTAPPVSHAQQDGLARPRGGVPSHGSLRWIFAALLVGWCAGTTGLLALGTWRALRFRRALALADAAPAAVQAEAARLGERMGLGRVPQLLVTEGRIPPLLWAWIGRARIVLPRELWTRLDRDARRALLVHELAHFRRRDHWVRWLELVATAAFWWVPAVWWLRAMLRDAEEACCDAWVARLLPDAARSYAGGLADDDGFLGRTAAGAASGGDRRAALFDSEEEAPDDLARTTLADARDALGADPLGTAVCRRAGTHRRPDRPARGGGGRFGLFRSIDGGKTSTPTACG